MRAICKAFHRKMMYAGGSQYECRVCGERWAAPHAPIRLRDRHVRVSRRAVLAYGVLLVLVVAAEVAWVWRSN